MIFKSFVHNLSLGDPQGHKEPARRTQALKVVCLRHKYTNTVNIYDRKEYETIAMRMMGQDKTLIQ